MNFVWDEFSLLAQLVPKVVETFTIIVTFDCSLYLKLLMLRNQLFLISFVVCVMS